MAITTPEAFLKALIKSELLSPEQLAHAQDTLLLADSADQFAGILLDEGILTEWQAERLLAGQTEFIIGNYVLLGRLGQGGMGSVFLARHKSMEREAALKIISRRVGKDPASRDRFFREARATASLDHPNIVRAFDIDKDKERFFIVMEYVPGQNLENLVEEEGPLDFEIAVDCIRQAAEGLAHAHGRDMIHCDIKPSNLIVTDSGTVKILDMGMARLVNQSATDSSSDRDNQILGTVDYMSPEQAMEGPDFDHRADIYSLGCTMYFLLTGHPPFDEGSLTQRIVQHQTQQPPDILEEHPDVPPDLVQICMKMMAKDPADRYQTAEELAEVMRRWRPPEPEPVAAMADASESSSTGVAIDEEDYASAHPLEQTLPPRTSLMADERRLVFWMAMVALAFGGLLAVVAVFVVVSTSTDDVPTQARSGGQGNVEPVQPQPAGPANPGQTEPGPRPPTGRRNTPNIESHVPPAQPQQTPGTKGGNNTHKEPGKKGHKQGPKQGEPKGHQPQGVQATGSSLQGTGSSTGTSDLQPISTVPFSTPHTSPPRPPDPPKAVDPFKGFPRLVDLPPAADTGQPVTLGTLRVPKATLPKIELLGGDLASSGSGRFELLPADGRPQWLVRLVDNDGTASGVARLTLRGGELLFAWLPTSSTLADRLRYCLLELHVGENSRVLSLTSPQSEEPLAVELGRSKIQKRFTVADAPQAAVRHLAITAVGGLPGRDPRQTRVYRLRRQVVFEPGDLKKIALMRSNGCEIELRVKFTTQGAVSTIDVTPYFRLATRKQSAKLTHNRLAAFDKQVRLLKERKATLEIAVQNPRLSDIKRKQRSQDLKEVKSELNWLERLSEWYGSSGGVLELQFQQFLVVDKHRVVLTEARVSSGKSDSDKSPSSPRPSPPPNLTPVGSPGKAGGATSTLQ